MKNMIVSLAICFTVFLSMTGCSDSKKYITTLNDVKNASIGAMTGTTGEQLAKKRFPDATVKSFDDIMDAVAALKSNQIEAVITGYPTAMNVCKHNPDLHYLSEAVHYENTSVAIMKGNEKLLSAVNTIISDLKNNGTLKDMSRRWFKTDVSPYEKVEISVPKNGELLKIGTSATREPFCFVDANRQVTGHDGELARIIGAKLGRPILFVDMKFSALIPSLQAGKVDMIIAGMTATEERKKSVDFSESYFKSSQVLLVKKTIDEETAAENKTTKLRTIDDVANKTVGVYAGTIHDGFVAHKYPQADIKRFNAPADIILSLKTNKIDVAFVDLASAKVQLKTNPEIGILTEEALTLPVGYGFNKNNPGLRERFNKFLKSAKSNGTYDVIYKRWFIEDPEKAQMPKIDFNKHARKITLGVSTSDLPNVAIVNGDYVGFDIELLKTFALSDGYNMKIITMEFSSLIAALASGKVDIIADCISITEERQRQIDFSEPYNQIKTAVLALKKNISIVDSKKMETLEYVADKIVGVYGGSVHDTFVQKKYPQGEIKRFNAAADMILALKTKKIDVALYDLCSANVLLKSNPEIGILTEDILDLPVGYGFQKNNPVLREKFNKFLRTAKSDGTYDAVYKRWFVEDPEKAHMPEIELDTRAPEIILGVCVGDWPNSVIVNGEHVGFDIEFLKAFAKREGYRMKIITLELPSLVASLASGKVDIIADGICITEERQKQVDFSEPYNIMKTAVMALKENIPIVDSKKMKTLDDVADKIIGVWEGTIYDGFVAHKYPHAEIRRLNNTTDLALSLKAKKIDVAFIDLIGAKVLIKSNPEIGILTDDVLTLPAGYGFNKNNPELRERFNKFLNKSKSDGTYDAMYKRWFIDDPEKAQMPTFDFNKNGRIITLGAAVGDLPHSAIVNGEHVGFDIEFLKTFAHREGFVLKITTMEFSSLIAALTSGKVDIIADGIAITEERQKQVDFSEPYNELKSSVLALKSNIAGFGTATGSEHQKEPSSTISFLQGIAESFHNNIIVENRYLLILNGLETTAIISLLSIIFGTLLGGLICFMRMSRKKLFLLFAKIYISILRGTPVLVLLMIIFYVVFASVDIDPVIVAVIAFGLNFAAYVSEMYRTGIEGVDKGQTEAGIAMGFTKITTFIYIIMPQAVRRILPVYKGEVISLVKMTSIVGYIAVQDLTKASDIIRSRTFDAFFPLIMVAVLYFFISWLLMLLLGYVERMTNPKLKLEGGIAR
jgi:polar amino acid transport system substrate-binding protein